MIENKRLNLTTALFYLLAAALFARLAIGVFYTNRYDTYWYRQWILDFGNGFFDIYSRADAIALDYPPLFLILVWPISLLYRIIPANTYEMADMLFLKLIPIIFDVACSWLFFAIGKKEGNAELGFIAAAIWALNPSMFFNSAMWGQTDSVMCFFLLAVFWFLRQKKLIFSTLLMAAACMIKFQCLFFAPVFLLGLLDSLSIGIRSTKLDNLSGLKKLGVCAAAGIGTVAIVFLPFSIASNEPTLFPSIYFSSGGKYPYCTLNAFNFFGALKLNWVEYSTPVFGAFTFAHLGYLLTALGILLLGVLWFVSKRRCSFVASIFIMQHIFMFMPAMHERYQVAVLPFALAAWLIHRDSRFGHLTAGLTLITLINQFMVLANATRGDTLPWSQNFNSIMAVLSFANLIIYLWSAAICLSFLLSDNESTEKEAE